MRRRRGAQLIEEALLLSVALVLLTLLVGGISSIFHSIPASPVMGEGEDNPYVPGSNIIGNVTVATVTRSVPIDADGRLTLLVPLYGYPSFSWSELIAATSNSSAKIVAIINPSNGPIDPPPASFTSGVKALKAVGITVWGYVDVEEGLLPVQSIESEIQLYQSEYGVSGVFLDDFPSPYGLANYTATVGGYASKLGLTTMGNPGTGPDSSYYGTVDALNVYEGSSVVSPGAISLEDANLPAITSAQSVIITESSILPPQSYFDSMASLVSYIYVSNTGSYFSLPSYLSQELQEVSSA